MGQGLPGRALTTAVLNDEIYAIVEMPYQGSRGWWVMGFYKWDGSVWTALGTYDDVPDARGTLAVYRGEIYYGGSLRVIGGASGFKGLARWDGEQWRPVLGGALDACTEVSIYNLNVIDDKLYCAGIFRRPDGMAPLMQFDGTTFTQLGTAPRPEKEYIGGIGTALYKGEIYLSGRFADGVNALAKWDGMSWTAVPTSATIILRMEVYNDQLYCYGDFVGNVAGIKSWDGSAWHDLELPPLTQNLMDYQIYHGDLYISTLGPRNVVARLAGTTWEVVGSFDNDVYDLEVFRDRLFASGWFTVSTDASATPLNHVALFCDGQCGSISGTVFEDHDDDCLKGDQEDGMQRRMIEIFPGPIYTMTGPDGTYGISLSPGSYTVGLVPRDHWSQTCPALDGTHSVEIESPDDSHDDVSFGVRATENIEDLRVSMVGGRARPGRSFLYGISYENVGTVTMTGTISLRLDPSLIFESSEPPTSRTQGSLLQWDFADLKPGEVRAIKVLVTVPPSTSIGTTICSDVSSEPYDSLYGADDRDTVCVDVTGSYDPNDISVTPFGHDDDGMITTADSMLTYTVRFQNTGNDTAFRVVVIDTVSSNLDIHSLRLGAASHDYTFSIRGSNILVWTFDDIMLPHKGENEPMSHGMFKYSLRQKKGLAAGMKIPNSASIYFDYNAPVATNTVVNTISAVLDVPEAPVIDDAAIYPNPALGEITIASDMAPGSIVIVQDILGRTVLERVADGGTMRLDMRGMPAGAYFVKIPSKSGTLVRRVMMMR